MWSIYDRNLTERRKGFVFERGEIAQIFGVDDDTVALWQRRGWLPVTRNRAYSHEKTAADHRAYLAWWLEMNPRAVIDHIPPPKPARSRFAHYLITDSAIEAFIEDRNTWYAWSPALITDPVWRAAAEIARDESPGQWLTTGEVAARFGYAVDTVRQWHQQGRTEGLEIVRYGHQVYWWSEGLETWAPPLDRPRQSAQLQLALEMARLGLTASEYARAIDKPLDRASVLLRLFMERGLLRREIDPTRSNRYIYWLNGSSL